MVGGQSRVGSSGVSRRRDHTPSPGGLLREPDRHFSFRSRESFVFRSSSGVCCSGGVLFSVALATPYT